jgi:signal peptidase II
MGNGADRRLFWGTVTAVVLADYVTKLLAVAMLSRHPVNIVGEWVRLRLVYNEGAAFGLHLGEHSRWIFFTLAVLALVVLGSMVRATRPGDRFRLAALALVCGGATGNLVDRIRSARGVVDFLDVGVGLWRWPTFNVADSAITVGAVALALSLWLEGRAEAQAERRTSQGEPGAAAT